MIDARDSETSGPPSGEDPHAHWRSLLNSIDRGLCIFEMLYDAAGRAVDYRFLEVNATFERHTGLKDAEGKTAHELVPGLEPHWVATYAHVAETGEPLRFEQGSEAMGGRWFEVDAVRIGGPASRKVALLFSDVTARKRAERDARFVSEVSERIRVGADPDALLWEVTEAIGRYLQVARCYFVVVDEPADRWAVLRDYRASPAMATLAGASALSHYPPAMLAELRAGRVVALPDPTAAAAPFDPRDGGFQLLGVSAMACVPLLREGRWVAAFVAFSDEPRAWAPRELALLETLTERTWNAVEQLRAAEALRASQKDLALALQAGQAGTFVWEIKGDVNRWSPELEALYGLAPGGFTGTYQAWAERVEPEDVRAFEAGMARTMAARLPEYTYEMRVVLPDGSRRWLNGRARFEYDHDGTPLLMRGINVDIDERKRGEQAIRRAHERLALALERLDGFLYEYSPATGDLERSDGFARLLGYDLDMVPQQGDWWDEQIHPADRAAASPLRRGDHAGDAGGYSLEYRVRHRAGHYLTVWDRGFIERDGAGAVTRLLGTVINITERKEATLATEAALARAEQATRERDLLISVAAHDLRTPLTVIFGQAQLLRRRAESAGFDERSARAVAAIAAQAERLGKLIEALLDLSRIQEGNLSVRAEPLDLAALLERVVDDVRSTAGQHRLSLQLGRAPLIIAADALRLEQVFYNLLANAVKYSPVGGAIQVGVAVEGATVRIAISDEGIGVPADALPHLFTRFYRAPNAGAQAASSMGVGLFVVRELVHAHGGTISVQSVEGQGSTFLVELPYPPYP